MNGIANRLAALSGAWFVLAVVLGSLGPTRTRLGSLVILSGFAAFAVFARVLHDRLHARGGHAMTTTAYGLVFLAVGAGELAALTVTEPRGTGHEVVEAAFVVSTIFYGLFVLASGTAARRRLLPAWLGWLGTALGIATVAAGVIGLPDPDALMPMPYVAALAWTGLVSVVLAVRRHAPASEPPSVPDVRAAQAAGAM
jgi:hypothetical protein